MYRLTYPKELAVIDLTYWLTINAQVPFVQLLSRDNVLNTQVKSLGFPFDQIFSLIANAVANIFRHHVQDLIKNPIRLIRYTFLKNSLSKVKHLHNYKYYGMLNFWITH